MERLGALLLAVAIMACDKQESQQSAPTTSFYYPFNTGQSDLNTAYTGDHPNNFRAQMRLAKVDSGGTLVRITFYHTLDGETYAVHAHDYDPDSTIRQPYEFAVNTEVFNQNPVGNGDTVEVTQYSPYSPAYLKEEYQGYFIVHDPLQPVQTKKPATFLIAGRFAR